jgi:hypothetical protein
VLSLLLRSTSIASPERASQTCSPYCVAVADGVQPSADSVQRFVVWRRALDATHNSLTPDDLYEIETELAGILPPAPLDLALALALDDAEMPIGLMLLNGDYLEALFVGRTPLEHALELIQIAQLT